MDRTQFDELLRATEILEESAKFFVSENRFAKRARRRLEKDRPQSAGAGREPFHGAILLHLSTLRNLLVQGTDAFDHLREGLSSTITDTLEVFDRLVLVSDQNKTSQHYPGLHRLGLQYNLDQKRGQKPKSLGFRMCLYRPPEERREELKAQVIACCEALGAAKWQPEDDASVLSDLDDIQEWRLGPGLTSQSERLRDVLQRYYGCSCTLPHETLWIGFVGLPVSMTKGVSAHYQLCFCKNAAQALEWRATDLLLLDRDDHVSSIPSTTAKGKKSVRFAPDAPLENWRHVDSICTAFLDAEYPQSIRASESGLQVSTTTSHQNPQPEMRSLQEVLSRQSAYLMPKSRAIDRVRLALIVTYTYLHLSGTFWWPLDDVDVDLRFVEFHKPSQKSLFRLDQPVLSLHSQSSTSANGRYLCTFTNKHRPSLPALGLLLLSIWKGAEVTWNTLEDTLEDLKGAETGEKWYCAINTCFSDTTLKMAGNLRQTQELRSTFVLKVVKCLQWLYERLHHLSINDAFPTLTHSVPKAVAQRNVPVNLHLPSIRSLNRGQDSSRLRSKTHTLYDDGNRVILKDQNDEMSANIWMNELQAKACKYCSLGRSTSPAKVAILDTGIALDRKKQFMFGRRIKAFRSWVRAADSVHGDSRKEYNDDEDGHGTHSVSVLIQSDPFSEIYIAKVFQGRNEKGGKAADEEVQKRVVNAIRYCVNEWKVNVISMSFGFEERVEKINEAINEANRANVVVFAAASNCGGNNQQSWPARHPTVISVHATDGYGNKYPRNPTNQPKEDNFAVLGMEVKGWWLSGAEIFRTGTSTATPIAAAIASLVLHFMRQAKSMYLENTGISEELYESRLKQLSTYAAMRQVFWHMSVVRDQYSYVQPWLLLSPDGKLPLTTADNIMHIVKDS